MADQNDEQCADHGKQSQGLQRTAHVISPPVKPPHPESDKVRKGSKPSKERVLISSRAPARMTRRLSDATRTNTHHLEIHGLRSGLRQLIGVTLAGATHCVRYQLLTCSAPQLPPINEKDASTVQARVDLDRSRRSFL